MSPFLESIEKVLLRDLGRLETELRAYATPEQIWVITGEIKNPAGNLCLHLCGNLQHYFGAVLGGTGYKRNRDAEFSLRNQPTEKLLEEIAAARKAVEVTLPQLSEDDVDKDYPEKVFDHPMTIRFFFIHLAAHFSYHLGQINYHRRLTQS